MSSVPELQSSRDRHLFGPGPKRVLSLDGGGLRGAIAIAFLEKLEAMVDAHEGKPTLLGDWFDLIGGTSTGAIIAGALALGYRASDIRNFYERLGPKVFQTSLWRVPGFRAKFDAHKLTAELERIVGPRTLDSDDLRTGLCVVTKRLDTGSAWVVTNSPKSMFWNTPADKSYIGNRHYLLANLIRASAAAPHYFDPELIEIAPGMQPGIFVDGAVTPHNNPALQLFLVAALPQFGLAWPVGAKNLTIVSIGTGTFRDRVHLSEFPLLRSVDMAIHALAAQIGEGQQLVLLLMSLFGDSPTPWPINSELGDLGRMTPPGGQALFRFMRYDVRLEADWLKSELGVTLDDHTLSHYKRLDDPETIPAIYRLGEQAAAKQMRAEDLFPAS